MDIKTRLTRCCGKPMGGLYQCHEGLRCSDCFDKLEGWREIEQLQLALGAMVSAYDHDWEVGDAVVRCRKIMADGQKPWDEIERLKKKVKRLHDELLMIEIIACHIGSTKEAIIHAVREALQKKDIHE